MPCSDHPKADTYPNPNPNRVGSKLCNAPSTIILHCEANLGGWHEYALHDVIMSPEGDMVLLAFRQPNCEAAREILKNLSAICQGCGNLHSVWEIRSCNEPVESELET